MKIKHLEIAKSILLTGTILTSIKVTGDAELIQDINNFLNQNNINIENINDFFRLGYNVSILTGFDLEKLTKDYQEIDNIYSLIINNISELIEYLNIENDPIKVFALFIYLYRNGYLSHNHEFYYSTDMKDFPELNGVDVVRGTGVCRSISSMFTDICNSVGLTASNIGVKVSSKSMEKKEPITTVELLDKGNSKKLARIASKVLSIFPIGNHLITLVEGDTPLMLDPTNDIAMSLSNSHRYTFLNNTGATMSYNIISSIVSRLFGQMKTNINMYKIKKISKQETITYDEYVKVYQETLSLIEENKDIFERFYELNKDLYKELYDLSEKQRNMIGRMVPIIPNRKK